MPPDRKLLLPEGDQLRLALELKNRQLFVISEDSNQTIPLTGERFSPHYLDMRQGISSYEIRHLVGETMLKLAKTRVAEQGFDDIGIAYDHLAGTPEAMTSYAATIADMALMSLLQPRVATGKITGNRAPILGRYSDSDVVAAFDDVVTEGQSKIDKIESFWEVGLTVADYFVVLDREEGGAPRVAEVTGVRVTPALGVSSMARMLRAERQITTGQFDNVARYLDRYGEPHAKNAMESPL